MPVIVSPPPPPGGGGGGPGFPPRPFDYTTRITWTSASGRITVLTDWANGYTLLPGARGLGMPEFEFYRRESGILDGDQVTGKRALPRELFFPVKIHGRDRADTIARKRRLAADLDPMEHNGGGRGVVTVQEYDGTSRRITAYYEKGAEGEMDRDSEGLFWMSYGLTFRAEQPWWELDPVELIYKGPEADGGRWLPILPLRARSSAVIGPGMGITVAGGVRTWPVWTLRGPLGPGVRLSNATTGRWLEIGREIAVGEELVIDTRPRRKSVRLGGVNAYQLLAHPGSTLWPLLPGENVVDVAAGQMGAESRLILRYTPLAPTT